jgi:DnaJ like chaperone protein
MEIQLHAAYADGSVDASVRSILSYVARRLGFSELQLTQMEAMVQAGFNFSLAPGGEGEIDKGGEGRGEGSGFDNTPSPYPLPQKGERGRSQGGEEIRVKNP